ncbi:MAG: PLP-dependent aminotransferase family protein [Planctomycetes bacterium]|nr:PLP-dependent aminotransferase family protein [Planctomycetota bacterium]
MIRSIVLDRTSDDPLYEQIARSLRASIRTGDLTPGTRLPTLRALAEELHVNRVTIRTAYDALIRDGLIRSHVGQGTFVAEPATSDQEASRIEPRDTPFSPEVLKLFERATANSLEGAPPQDTVDFAGLIPDERLFDVDAFRSCLDDTLREEGSTLLQYGDPRGDHDLRAWIAGRLRQRGVGTNADEILIVHGAQQGIGLVARAFVPHGLSVVTEQPTYHQVLALFTGLGLRSHMVPMTEQGIDLERLEREAFREASTRLLYTMPDFQNPTGLSQSEETRDRLVELAERHDRPILEDDYEQELRFHGEPRRPLAARGTGLVLHLGTFSKSLFPGLRIGWIQARRHVIEHLLQLKSVLDLGGGLLMQRALFRFVEAGHYDRHLERVRTRLAAKHAAAGKALATFLRGRAHWTTPEGGFAVWVRLEHAIDTRRLRAHALREGVLFSPGDLFMGSGPSTALRLSLSRVEPERIEEGIARLARALDALSAGPSTQPTRPHRIPHL